MSFNFPNTPSVGQEYVAVLNGTTYVWNGSTWMIKQQDAPQDGKTYGRKNLGWMEVAAQSFPDAPADGVTYGRKNTTWVNVGSVSVAWGDITGKPSTFPPDAHTHSYSSLTGIPSTFAPSAHNHPISEVTNLQTTLDGKAALVHTHSYSSLTGIPSTFTPSAHVHAIADTTGLQAALDAKIGDAPNDGQQYARQSLNWAVVTPNDTAAQILTKLLTVDGTGSGLDADLLDAQSGAYYLARANHTGTQANTTITGLGTASTKNIHVASSAPGSPATGDLWVDTT